MTAALLPDPLWGIVNKMRDVALWDPLTIGVDVSLVIAVGPAAGCAPALRASRVELMAALRHE
jgi:hypothetical protein